MGRNYSAIAVRPAGGLWTSANDLSKYVMLELAKGKLPDGTRLVSESNLAQRQVPNAIEAEGATYGMGLRVDKHWGVTVVDHGGSVWGYHADMIWLPDYGLGAVILTNGDQGNVLVSALMRKKLLEQVFDGKPEADQQLSSRRSDWTSSASRSANDCRFRPTLSPWKQLAANYRSEELGGGFGRTANWRATWNSGPGRRTGKAPWPYRKNDDGTVSFIGISPTMHSWELVVGEKGGKRTLIEREPEHDWVFVEQKKS